NLRIGIFIVGITLLLSHLTNLPEFICGLGLGIGIAFELIGVYSMNHDTSKIKSYKMKLLRKCLNK
ncbi:MAG: hypothetical protein Q8862_12340, partial [Bacteroidota bacterium]|nr:hypothetical protein [Bacteroidota bacterium]